MSPPPRAYKKVARAEAQEATRTALLDAAEATFLSGSWEQTSLEKIATGAGVTKQTLLRHFGSKEGLLGQAYARGYDRVREQRFTAPTDDISGAVDTLLDHYMEFGERALKVGDGLGAEGVLAEIGESARALHYEWVDHAFGGWLTPMGAARRRRVRGALIAICDVHFWALLSRDLGFSRAQVHATLVMTINRLLGESE